MKLLDDDDDDLLELRDEPGAPGSRLLHPALWRQVLREQGICAGCDDTSDDSN